jgi:hypothetical protein
MANYPVVPDVYKGKKTATMSRAQYEKMLQEMKINKKGVKPTEYPGEEPDDATAKKVAMAKGGAVKKFKACAACPSPAKCKAAGKCLAKKAATGMLVIPVKMEKSTATKYAGASKLPKKPAVKAKKKVK